MLWLVYWSNMHKVKFMLELGLLKQEKIQFIFIVDK